MVSDPQPRRGRFFVLDGLDGCGKSTQAQVLVERLLDSGRRVSHLREPGSTGLGEWLREGLLRYDPDVLREGPNFEVGPPAQVLLFAAARRQMLDEVVRPLLEDGQDVVCERFNAATYAYQAVAGKLDREEVLSLLETWSSDPAPDRIFILELEPALAFSRMARDGDRFENREMDFHQRVQLGFQEYARRYPEITRRIPADGPPEDVAGRIWEEVARVR